MRFVFIPFKYFPIFYLSVHVSLIRKALCEKWGRAAAAGPSSHAPLLLPRGLGASWRLGEDNAVSDRAWPAYPSLSPVPPARSPAPPR